MNANTKYRADIDGLRAVAVLLVVVYHAFPRLLPGGYVGVDVFFVISGFLITRILETEFAHARFSLLNFYARRFRRILPALAVVVTATWIIGWYLLIPDELQQLGRHLVSSGLFISNFRLWLEAGYFDRSAELKPLLHLWSLAVEEQFYLFWPLLIWLYVRLTPRRGHLLFGTLFLGSFAVCLARRGETDNFFLLPARFWELMVGAALNRARGLDAGRAALTLNIQNLFSRHAAVPALGALFWSGLCMGPQTPYPGWPTLVPTLAAGALILSPGSWLNGRILSRPICVWFGKISYPLYLWHWPVLAFLRLLYGHDLPAPVAAYAIVISVILAAATWLGVEQPIQRLSSGGPRVTRKILAVSAASLALLITLGQVTAANKGFKSRFAPGTFTDVSRSEQDALVRGYHATAACRNVTAQLPPGLGCSSTDDETAPVLVLGDSHAGHLEFGLHHADNTYRWMILSRSGCPPITGVPLRGQWGRRCMESNSRLIDYVARTRGIQAVVLSSFWTDYLDHRRAFTESENRVFFADAENPEREFGRGYLNMINALQAAGKIVVLAKDTPAFADAPERCFRRRPRFLGVLPHCEQEASQVRADHRIADEIIAGLVRKVHQPLPVFDPLAQFCGGESCPQVRGARSLYVDNEHLSSFGSILWAQAFVPWFGAQLGPRIAAKVRRQER